MKQDLTRWNKTEQDGTSENKIKQDQTRWNKKDQEEKIWNNMKQDETGWNETKKQDHIKKPLLNKGELLYFQEQDGKK